MPPKKENKKAPPPPEPVKDEFDDMTIDQLKRERVTLSAKLGEIRKNRNYYLKERNMFAEFNTIVHQEVIKTKAHIRNVEAQMEWMQDNHRKDVKVYLQKVIHLEYENANNVDQVEADAFKAREEDEKQHLEKKEKLRQQKLIIKGEIEEMERKHEAEIRMMRERERKELDKLKSAFEAQFQTMVSNSERRLQELKDDMELQRKMEIHEIEERKNRHINDLMANHENQFNLMRRYYNSITRDNLELIRSLNDEIELLKAKYEENEKLKKEYEAKKDPLDKELKEEEHKVEELKKKLKDYLKQKASLKLARAGLAVMEEQYKDLSLKHKEAQEDYAKTVRERDGLYATFEETVLGVRGRSDARNRMLEKMLDEYKDKFESKKAQFTAVLRQSNLDPTILHNVTQKLDDVLTAKNEQIKEMKYECAKITKAHNDLVRVYEDKLREFGIPESELDLEPLVELDPQLAGAGNVPAGLIVS